MHILISKLLLLFNYTMYARQGGLMSIQELPLAALHAFHLAAIFRRDVTAFSWFTDCRA